MPRAAALAVMLLAACGPDTEGTFNGDGSVMHPQPEVCEDYIRCLAVEPPFSDEPTEDEEVAEYGIDGGCWDESRPERERCEGHCAERLDLLERRTRGDDAAREACGF